MKTRILFLYPGFRYFIITLFFLPFVAGYGQQSSTLVNATSQTNNSTALLASVTNAGNAVDGNLNSASSLNITVGILNAVFAEQTLIFGSTVPADTPLRLKLGQGTGLLAAGIFITVSVYNGGSQVGSDLDLGGLLDLNLLSGSSEEEIIITPGGSYDRVVVELRTTVGLAASIDVYEAYYFDPSGSNPCDEPYDLLDGVTGGILSGLTDVVNPENAIDGNLSSYADIQKGVSVLNGNYLAALFENTTSGVVDVLIGQPGTLLDLTVLQGFAIRVSTDGDNVRSYSAGNLLSIRLLDSGDRAWISFEPSGSFNRIEVVAGELAGALESIRVYEIRRSTPPTETSHIEYVYEGNSLNLEATNFAAGMTVEWYDSTTMAQEGSGETFSTPVLNDDITYQAVLYDATCDKLAEIETIRIIVLALTTEDPGTGEVNVAYSDNLTALPVDGPSNRDYNFSNVTGDFPPGLTLNPDGSISGTPTLAGTYVFFVDITDTTDIGNPLYAGNYQYTLEISQVLAIVLEDFTVHSEGKISILKWKVLFDHTIRQFFIERSSDGIVWSTIDRIDNDVKSASWGYDYRDETAFPGDNYYRIVIVENDDNTMISPVRKIHLTGQKSAMVYPNPMVSFVEISNADILAGTIRIYNLVGKMVVQKEFSGNGQLRLDVTHLPAGTYHLTLEDHKFQSIYQQKLIKISN